MSFFSVLEFLSLSLHGQPAWPHPEDIDRLLLSMKFFIIFSKVKWGRLVGHGDAAPEIDSFIIELEIKSISVQLFFANDEIHFPGSRREANGRTLPLALKSIPTEFE